MSPELPESSHKDNHKGCNEQLSTPDSPQAGEAMQSATEDVPIDLFDSVKQTLEFIFSEYSKYPSKDPVRFGPLGERLPLIDSSTGSCPSLIGDLLYPQTNGPYGFNPRTENGV
jgi:hypothetical protein